MNQPSSTRAARRRAHRPAALGRALLALGLGGALVAVAGAATRLDAVPAPAVAARDSVPAAGAALAVVDDTLTGRSGKLRARWFSLERTLTFPFLRQLLGDDAARQPGVYPVRTAESGGAPFAFITMRPFADKIGGRIGSYRIGFWPGERGRAVRSEKYGNPEGFIQVTPDNKDTPISEHFRLADFLTHDQQKVWPKYLVLDATLVDKLELVLLELRARGYDARRLHVMSGFRTPQYNRSGGETAGRAELSRHQYGDAADVWVENGAGRMADLNGDGRVDARDAGVVAEAAERVEQAHPELVGGIGIYRSTRSHGPFVHIDTRGYRARWGRG